MSDLIIRSALLKSYDIAKMVEYDETGCGVTRIAMPVQAIKDITHWKPLPEPPEVEHETVHDCNS